MAKLKPCSEYTQEDIDKVHLFSLKEAAKKLGLPVAEVVVRDGSNEYSTPDGKKVEVKPIG